MLELNDQASICVNKNFYSFVIEAGGYDNLTLREKHYRNYLDKAWRLRLEMGNAEAIHHYFVKMQRRNSKFFYVMDLDEEGQLWNVFLGDARSKQFTNHLGMLLPSTRRTWQQVRYSFSSICRGHSLWKFDSIGVWFVVKRGYLYIYVVI